MLFYLPLSVAAVIFHYVAGLAVECLAKSNKGRKPYCVYVPVLELRKVDIGNADLFRKLVQAHFAVRHYSVKPENYFSHIRHSLSEGFVRFLLKLCAVFENYNQNIYYGNKQNTA